MKNIMGVKGAVIVAGVVVVLGAGGWYISKEHSASNTASVGMSDTVATVNGEKITRGQLTTAESQLLAEQGASATSSEAKAAVQSAALDSLIAETLLKQAASHAGITASSTGVDTQMQAIKSQFQTADAYQQALKAQGVTEDELRTQISDDLAIQEYLDQTLDLASTTATQAEIQSAYDQAVAGQTGAPALKDVQDQVKQMVIQQKQQNDIAAQVAKLRAAGNVQVLI